MAPNGDIINKKDHGRGDCPFASPGNALEFCGSNDDP